MIHFMFPASRFTACPDLSGFHVSRFMFCAFMLCLTLSWQSWAAESDETTHANSNTVIKTPGTQMAKDNSASRGVEASKYTTSRESERQTNQSTYPLFRTHSPQYYPPKTVRTAVLLSATLPGLGQTYAGSSGKGLAFLVMELGLLSAAGFNLDRAAHYDDLTERFVTGFYDPYHSDDFLTPNQGRVRTRSHAIFGAILLASGIGGYIWNILDAAETVEQYNERRFSAQVQQTGHGETYLTVIHRF